MDSGLTVDAEEMLNPINAHKGYYRRKGTELDGEDWLFWGRKLLCPFSQKNRTRSF
jgi:hypothetical protein